VLRAVPVTAKIRPEQRKLLKPIVDRAAIRHDDVSIYFQVAALGLGVALSAFSLPAAGILVAAFTLYAYLAKRISNDYKYLSIELSTDLFGGIQGEHAGVGVRR